MGEICLGSEKEGRMEVILSVFIQGSRVAALGMEAGGLYCGEIVG